MPPLDDATRTETRLLLRESASVAQRPALPVSTPPPAPPAPARPPWTATLTDELSGRLIAMVSTGWVGLWIAYFVQPRPDDPHASLPTWATAVNTVADIALLATIVGFAVRQRWALLTSGLAASGWVVAVVACPLVDHHETVGAAWGALLAISAGLAAASAIAFARTRRR